MIVAGGALPGNPNAPAVAVAAVVTVAAAAALVYGRRLPLLAAAVATAGIAVEGDGLSSDIGCTWNCRFALGCVGSERMKMPSCEGAMVSGPRRRSR